MISGTLPAFLACHFIPCQSALPGFLCCWFCLLCESAFFFSSWFSCVSSCLCLLHEWTLLEYSCSSPIFSSFFWCSWQRGDRPDNDLRWAMQHPEKNYKGAISKGNAGLATIIFQGTCKFLGWVFDMIWCSMYWKGQALVLSSFQKYAAKCMTFGTVGLHSSDLLLWTSAHHPIEFLSTLSKIQHLTS